MDLRTVQEEIPKKLPLLHRLKSPDPLQQNQSTTKQSLLGRMSLLERMNMNPLEPNSPQSSLTTVNTRSPSLGLYLESAHSSTTTPTSPKLKRRKRSTSTSTRSARSTETTDPNLSLPNPKRRKRSTSPFTISSIRSQTECEEKETMTPRGRTLTMPMNPLERKRKSRNLTWVGMTPTTVPLIQRMSVVEKPASVYKSTIETSRDLSSSRNSPDMLPPASLPLNGSGFSEEKPSTSTTSSLPSIVLQLMRRERLASATRKSALESLMRNGALARLPNGHPLGALLLEQQLSLSPTVLKNCKLMGTSSNPSSQENSRVPTRESSCSTLPYATSSKEVITHYSPTVPSTFGSIPRSLCRTESEAILPQALIDDQVNHAPAEAKLTSAIALIPPEVVHPPIQSASIGTSVRTAKREDMVRTNAPSKPYHQVLGCRPRYLRYNLWNPDSHFTPTIADWSENAIPLPRPPSSELNDPIACETISQNPELFKIVTPINVDRFQELLSDHPNPLFVQSVCAGLREGFWPWADTHKEGYPSTYDAARPTPHDQKKAQFIRDQRDVELQKGRFSTSFGTDLLPGMYCMPAHAVPKPNSTDLRMVTDHSAGPFSLNSMVDHSLVTGYPLDNMTHIGEMLLAHHRSMTAKKRTIMWKSDIAEAYRLMPLHPHWQLKQVNTIDGQRYIDRNNPFGNSSSAAIFISFNSLVAWIAKNKRGIQNLATYIDDSSGFDLEDDMLPYSPYHTSFPRHQTLLLELWDEISIPHKLKKQIFGPIIPIIGIDVDPNAMTLTLSPERLADLCDALDAWSIKPINGSKSNYQLKYWQQMGGWVNWSFNVFPLLRPCLNNFYHKISGVHSPTRRIWVNNAIRDDFAWAARHIRTSSGIHIFRSSEWDLASADFTIYCDACPEGLGFWYPDSSLGFYAPTPPESEISVIFYFEALCVFCALKNVEKRASRGAKVVIYTDNLNTVQMFNSLACLPAYNQLLRHSVDILLATDIDLRVLHVPGEHNSVADALSRCRFSDALNIVSDLKISPFEPPRWTLGATKK
jgi:hypothetical protein